MNATVQQPQQQPTLPSSRSSTSTQQPSPLQSGATTPTGLPSSGPAGPAVSARHSTGPATQQSANQSTSSSKRPSLPHFFTGAAKTTVALAGIAVAVYHGWQTLKYAKWEAAHDQREGCGSDVDHNRTLTTACIAALNASTLDLPMSKLKSRDVLLRVASAQAHMDDLQDRLDSKRSKSAMSMALIISTTFACGVLTAVFFGSRVQLFRPVVSPARSDAAIKMSESDGHSMLRCAECSRPVQHCPSEELDTVDDIVHDRVGKHFHDLDVRKFARALKDIMSVHNRLWLHDQALSDLKRDMTIKKPPKRKEQRKSIGNVLEWRKKYEILESLYDLKERERVLVLLQEERKALKCKEQLLREGVEEMCRDRGSNLKFIRAVLAILQTPPRLEGSGIETLCSITDRSRKRSKAERESPWSASWVGLATMSNVIFESEVWSLMEDMPGSHSVSDYNPWVRNAAKLAGGYDSAGVGSAGAQSTSPSDCFTTKTAEASRLYERLNEQQQSAIDSDLLHEHGLKGLRMSKKDATV